MDTAEDKRSSANEGLKRSWGLRGVCHALVALGAWVLFFYWWDEVLGFTRSRDVFVVLVFLAVTVAATTVLNLVWVGHNIRIYRRKGPRTRVPRVSQDRDSDSLGRPIRLPASGSICRCPVVTVTVNEKEKIMDHGEAS